jgi:hypothetical protein
LGVESQKVQRDYYKAIKVVLQRTQYATEYDDEKWEKLKKETTV